MGGLVWAGYWFRQQGMVAASGPDERESLSRRILIYLAFGVSTLAGGVSVISILVMVLSRVFEGGLSSDLFVDGSWAIGTIVTGLSVSAYHWFILRDDRYHTTSLEARQEEPTPKRITIGANRTNGNFVARRIQRLGHDIAQWEILHATSPGQAQSRIPAKEAEELVNTIDSTDAAAILVIIDQSGYQILPYKNA
jgi:hypothetical protein